MAPAVASDDARPAMMGTDTFDGTACTAVRIVNEVTPITTPIT